MTKRGAPGERSSSRVRRGKLPAFRFEVNEVNLVGCGMFRPHKFSHSRKWAFFDGFCLQVFPSLTSWFADGSGSEAPQCLVAGSSGGEGQASDFTRLRVYPWSSSRKRYETAYVESNLCGHLSIQLSRIPAGPEFLFAEAGENALERT